MEGLKMSDNTRWYRLTRTLGPLEIEGKISLNGWWGIGERWTSWSHQIWIEIDHRVVHRGHRTTVVTALSRSPSTCGLVCFMVIFHRVLFSCYSLTRDDYVGWNAGGGEVKRNMWSDVGKVNGLVWRRISGIASTIRGMNFVISSRTVVIRIFN